MGGRSNRRREPWFAVGKPLPPRRGVALMIFSFLLPLGVWSFVSYASFLWEVDYRISVTSDLTDKTQIAATYSPGDKIEESYFREFQAAVRNENASIRAQDTADAETAPSPRSIRTANKKILRSFEPVLLGNDWYEEEADPDTGLKNYQRYYEAVFAAWKGLAEGSLTPKRHTLSDENLAIVQTNWASISAVSPAYDANNFVSIPLLKLVPQGNKEIGRPSYLPAPHELVQRAWLDFAGNSPLGELKIGSRYLSSLQVVFGGFLLAVLIGVPIALLAGTFTFFSRLFEPFIDFFRYMPAPAFSTVLMAIFGLAQAPKIALVFLGTLPQLILMVSNTTRLLDRSLLDAGQTLGARKGQLVRRIVIPGILPSLYNDLRILLGWAWTWLVIAELIGEKSGLTAIIDTQGRRFHFETVYPIILLIGLTGFLTDQFLAGLRPYFFPWEAKGKGGMVARVAAVVLWLPATLIKALQRLATVGPDPSKSES